MVNLSKLFHRVMSTGKHVAEEAPDRARQAASEARRTAGAAREALDERTDGRFGQAVTRGTEAVGRIVATPGEARDAFREEAAADPHRPETYRPDPIDAPAPIDRPEPI